jgi:hypothetical protein
VKAIAPSAKPSSVFKAFIVNCTPLRQPEDPSIHRPMVAEFKVAKVNNNVIVVGFIRFRGNNPQDHNPYITVTVQFVVVQFG